MTSIMSASRPTNLAPTGSNRLLCRTDASSPKPRGGRHSSAQLPALSHILRIGRTRLGHVLPIGVAGAVLGIARTRKVAGRTSYQRLGRYSWGDQVPAAVTNHDARTPGAGGDRLDTTTAAPAVSMLVPVRVPTAVHGFAQVQCVRSLPNTRWRRDRDRVGRGCCQGDQS